MSDPKAKPPNMPSESKIPITVSFTALGLIAIVWAVSSAFSDKADKSEVRVLREQFTELSARQREDVVIQKNILSLLEKMDGRLGKIEDNQMQDIQRRKWEQPFKQESPPSSPSPNANR